jgi:hypothetical protein
MIPQLIHATGQFWPSRSKSYSQANKTVPGLEWLNHDQMREHSGQRKPCGEANRFGGPGTCQRD